MKGQPDGFSAEENRLLSFIDEHETIEHCQKLVQIPSVFGSEYAISTEIERDLCSIGLSTKSVPVSGCAPSVVGTHGGGNNQPPALIFNGHMDTVQVCDGWTIDPFAASLQDGKIYGLGAVDMKGGLTSQIMAAKALVSSGVQLRQGFAVHVVTDEECWSRGTASLINSGYYEGAKFCIVGEPSHLTRLRNARRGQALVNVTVRGKATHGAQPERGINAVTEAAKVVIALSKIKERTHPTIVDFKLAPLKSSTCVLKIEGGSDALSVPDSCVLRVDRHVLPGSSLEEGLAEIRTHLEDNLDKETLARIKIEFTPRPSPPYEPFETDPQSLLVRTVGDVAPMFGYEAPLAAGFSVADDCLIAVRCKIPTVSYGPSGDIETNASARAHEKDEFVYARQVADAAKIYALSALRLLNKI